MPLTLSSPSFMPGKEIPSKYTGEGLDCSPPLTWTEPPSGTASFVLIVDDPDAPDPQAPRRTWVHWVLYNLPATVRGLKEGISSNELPVGTGEGCTDSGQTGYGGPMPLIGKHRYFFKLYALKEMLPDLHTPTKKMVETAMEGKILAYAELIGTYEKHR